MSASEAQAWVAVVGGLVTAIVAVSGFLNYRTKRDYLTTVGTAFSAIVDALSDDKLTKQLAAAILLRRFFDRNTELGRRGLPYKSEAVNVIVGMLREEHDPILQKTLADGLRYAKILANVDLQQCDLRNAYLGRKIGDEWSLDLSNVDLYEAKLDGASLKQVKADSAVFFHASLRGAVFQCAVLTAANFRNADLAGAKFAGADIGGADFGGAENIPDEVMPFLVDGSVALVGARVPDPEGRCAE